MERLAANREPWRDATTGEPASGVPDNAARLLQEAEARAALPEKLFSLIELDVLYDTAHETLWTFMNPSGRPSFTPAMLGEFEEWQRLIALGFGRGRSGLKFLVLGSRSPGVFCLGGDLELFQRLIRARDRGKLVHYGYRCVEILHRNLHALDLPVLTIGLVQGAALGGGFEALLSFDHIIAERGATFGLPETMFGLFPGMGAHAFLSRKLGDAEAERIILSNRTYSAEDMHSLGIVHQLAEPGAGLATARAYIAKNARRHAGLCGARRAMREASPVPLAELKRIVDHWADSALELREQDLRAMQRLAAAQTRLSAAF